MRAQLRFSIDTLINRGYIVLGHHCDAQKKTALSPWWSPANWRYLPSIDTCRSIIFYFVPPVVYISWEAHISRSVFHRICITMSFCTESQSIFGSSNIADGRFWVALVVTRKFFGRGCRRRTPTATSSQPRTATTSWTHTYDRMVGRTSRSYVVIQHEKTWVLMVPERNNVFRVHDDRLYPHYDTTTV
jgi:hypothetical protein